MAADAVDVGDAFLVWGLYLAVYMLGAAARHVEIWKIQYCGCVVTQRLRGRYGTDQSRISELFLSE